MFTKRATQISDNFNLNKGDIMKKVISIVLIILFLSGILYPLEAQEVELPKSEGTAQLLSFGSTAIPLMITYIVKDRQGTWVGVPLGLVIGPSIGHFYAGQTGRVLKGILIRGVVAPAIGFGSMYVFVFSSNCQEMECLGAVVAGIGVAGGIAVISAIDDILTAPASVRKYNESIGKTGNVYLVPKIDIKEEKYGLSLVYCF